MELLCFLLKSFFHLLLCFDYLTTAAAQESYKYVRLYVNKTLPYPFATFSDISLMQCIAECSHTDKCVGFTYNQMSTQCDLSEHYLPFAGNLLESQAGASVYYPQVLHCSLVYSTHLASESINTITTPNYPDYYPHNTDQYWLIVKPTRVSTLEIKFQPIDVELSDGCAYDSVTFYNGFCPSEELVINRVCGAANSYTFPASNTLHVLVRFLTDSDNIDDANHVGFSMEFRIV